MLYCTDPDPLFGSSIDISQEVYFHINSVSFHIKTIVKSLFFVWEPSLRETVSYYVHELFATHLSPSHEPEAEYRPVRPRAMTTSLSSAKGLMPRL